MSNGKNLLIIYTGHYGTDDKQHQKGSTATIAEWISQGASQTLGTKVTVIST